MIGSLQKHFSSFAVLLLLIFLPLYVENAYYNITGAKFRAFFFAVIILAVPLCLVMIYRFLKRSKYQKMPLDLIDIGVLCFACVSLISCLFSGRVKDSFFGSDGWWVGAFSVCVLACLYFFFSRNHSYSQNIWLPIYAVNIVIFIIGILQFARFDLLGFHDNILEKQYYQYISTYGNTNWYAGYLCMLLPMAFVFFAEAKTRLSYSINLVFLIFALSNLLLCISDGAYIGLAFCVFFALPFIFKTKERLKRALLVLVIAFSEAIIIRLLPCYSDLMEKADSVSALPFELKISVPLLIICLALLICLNVTEKDFPKARKTICIVMLSLMVILVITVFIYTVVTFSDSWGSSRGAIWRVSFENYSGYTVKEKLIGIGPELLRNEYLELQKGLFKGLAILSSHSEPIQLLLTTGVLGLLSWFGVYAGVAVSFIKILKTKKDITLSFAFFLPITAYFAQSFVNSATTVNLCLLCIILAFYRISIKTTE